MVKRRGYNRENKIKYFLKKGKSINMIFKGQQQINKSDDICLVTRHFLIVLL